MEERRHRQVPTDTDGYLRQLPSRNLLDRLPIAMLGVGRHGDIAYANPAFAELLGYGDAEAVTGRELPPLLTGHERRPAEECAHLLQTTRSVVEWNHDHGYVLRTTLSPPLLMRATDPLLLVGVNDVTAWHWETDNRG